MLRLARANFHRAAELGWGCILLTLSCGQGDAERSNPQPVVQAPDSMTDVSSAGTGTSPQGSDTGLNGGTGGVSAVPPAGMEADSRGGGASVDGAGGAAAMGAFALSSPAFENSAECTVSDPTPCGVFPDENTSYMENANISPELRWSGVPAGTRSFALTLTDLTFGQPHWAIWNIPGDSTVLPADVATDSPMPAVPAGSVQANATFAEGEGYFGPQAPCNVYQFELFALSVETFSPEDAEYVVLVRSELEELGDSILGRATLTARNDFMMMCE